MALPPKTAHGGASPLRASFKLPMKVRVVRSLRRKRTISGRVIDNLLELQIPAFLPQKEIDYFTRLFLKKLQKKNKVKTERFLTERASYLYKKYFGKNVEKFTVFWSKKQRKIFGICNHKRRIIRISSRLKKVPTWVLDYVILHELCHLVYPHHQKKFWQTVNQYPRTEKAKGFLLGMNFIK